MAKRCPLAVQLFSHKIFDINKTNTNEANGRKDID